MFYNWILTTIFAIFLGGCALVVSGNVLIRIDAGRCAPVLKSVGAAAWTLALGILLVCLALSICGFPVI
jgi:hypothetical protein